MSDASKRLIQARTAAGYESAADAARDLRMRYPTYAAHEDGWRGFNRQATRYAQFFGVRVEWLLMGHGPMKLGKKSRVEEIFDALPPERQREYLEYGEFLKGRSDN